MCCSYESGWGKADVVVQRRHSGPGMSSQSQLVGDACVAGAAQRGEGIKVVEVPPAKWRVAAMMRVEIVRAIARSATIAVAGKQTLAQLLPLGAYKIRFVLELPRHFRV